MATKAGHYRTGPDRWEIDSSPEAIRRQTEQSLRDLRVERIDLHQLHRPDPKVPIEESVAALKELQDETGGFRAFFSWTFQSDGNRLSAKVPRETMPTSFDYLLTQAVSRIYLDNMPHIGSSWVTQGKKIGQVALGFGADDLGSVMIEENVVSAAGTTHRTSAEELAHLIRAIGKTPVQRDTLYRDVKIWN